MIRKLLILFIVPALAACASTGGSKPIAQPTYNNPAISNVKGLEAVMGKTAGQLTRLFGKPQADVAEPPARKLQFASGACILDAYLYPKERGGEGTVIHVDARRSDGAEVDRASCVNALRLR